MNIPLRLTGLISLQSKWLGHRQSKSVLCLVTQSFLTLCNPMDCSPPGTSIHWDSPGKNTGSGCHALFQGIFPIQGSNPGLLNCRQILYCLRHQGSLSMYRYKWSCFSTHSSLLFFIRTGILESWGSPGFSKIKIYSFSGPRSFYPLKLLSPNCFLSNRKSLKIVSYWWSPITFTVMCLYI